jgi:alpha-tubulin suppressor-like RCC1 family protein
MKRGAWIVASTLWVASALACTKSTQSRNEKAPTKEAAEAARPALELTRTSKPAMAKVTQIAAGWEHTCVLTDRGTVRCWGKGEDGRLGYGNTANIGDDELASAGGDIDLGGHAIQITAGERHTCAILVGGAVRCWGSGEFGKLGHGNTKSIGDDETPAAVGDVPVGAPVKQIAAGGRHTCALLDSGDVRCWGQGRPNQLGYGGVIWEDIGDDETPAKKGNVELGAKAVQLALLPGGTCALLETGAVRCWGGHLVEGGDDPDELSPEETEVPARLKNVVIGAPVKELAGGDHLCALLESGSVRCFGFGANGALGYPEVSGITLYEGFKKHGDVQVGGKVVKLAVGGEHTCAILEGGAVRCWGNGHLGKLGYGSTRNVGELDVPAAAGDVDVGGPVVDIAAGGLHTCALLESGAVRCWGSGAKGQLGYGNTKDIGDDEPPAAAGDVPVF